MNGVVVGVGHCAVDYLGVVPRYPEVDSKEEIAEFSQQGGGPAATAIVTLACLGVPTRIAAKISDDHFGDFILDGLQTLGVDTTHMVIAPGFVSPFSFIAVEGTSGKRTIFWTRGSVPALEPDEVSPRILDGASCLIIDGHQPAAQVKLAEEARSRGIKVVLDAGALREGMGDLVSLSHILIASERFATEVAPAAELESTLAELGSMGPEMCVITLGLEGSIGTDGTRIVRTPAFEVDVVDTTGAGDVYHGAFLYGVREGWPIERLMRFASAAAGLKCRTLGGRAGIPSLEEVLAVLPG
jgi:sulfofructose kinase